MSKKKWQGKLITKMIDDLMEGSLVDMKRRAEGERRMEKMDAKDHDDDDDCS